MGRHGEGGGWELECSSTLGSRMRECLGGSCTYGLVLGLCILRCVVWRLYVSGLDG